MQHQRRFHSLSKRPYSTTAFSYRTTFATAADFLNSNQLQEISCLIIDVQIPEMSGIELLARLKSSGHLIPVIVVTAFPDESIRERAMQLGAFSFLTKPLDDVALTGCLDRVIHSG